MPPYVGFHFSRDLHRAAQCQRAGISVFMAGQWQPSSFTMGRAGLLADRRTHLLTCPFTSRVPPLSATDESRKSCTVGMAAMVLTLLSSAWFPLDLSAHQDALILTGNLLAGTGVSHLRGPLRAFDGLPWGAVVREVGAHSPSVSELSGAPGPGQ